MNWFRVACELQRADRPRHFRPPGDHSRVYCEKSIRVTGSVLLPSTPTERAVRPFLVRRTRRFADRRRPLAILLALAAGLTGTARADSAISPNACIEDFGVEFIDEQLTISGTAVPNPTNIGIPITLESTMIEITTEHLVYLYNKEGADIVGIINYSGSASLQGTNTVEGGQSAAISGGAAYVINDPDTVPDTGDESVNPPSILLSIADTTWNPTAAGDIEFSETFAWLSIDGASLFSLFSCFPGEVDVPPTTFTSLPPAVFETVQLLTIVPAVPAWGLGGLSVLLSAAGIHLSHRRRARNRSGER